MGLMEEGSASRGLIVSLTIFSIGFIAHIVLHMIGWDSSAIIISYATGIMVFTFPIWVAWCGGIRYLDKQGISAWYISSLIGYLLTYSWLWGLNGQVHTQSMWIAALFSPLFSMFVYPVLLPEPVNRSIVWGGRVYHPHHEEE
ncbi:MAG: hypothetical protein QF440_02450 [Candidatus Thalassarchaeaceae archaeon]|jgi:hypothetical protein|nr:hypothetical protein [Candidatus Thalassarchaeaceae archaeon]